jgi:hypothetical protein
LIKNKYLYIGASIYLLLIGSPTLVGLYFKGKSILYILGVLCVALIILNSVIILMNFIIDKVYRWYEKRSKEKYNLYEWLGNPHQPISYYTEFSSIINFDPKNFNDNCEIIKKKILSEATNITELKSFKKYLELKTQSPRFASILSSSQSIFISVITSSLITLLNFMDSKGHKLVISYIFLFLFTIGLFKLIDTISKAIDRDKLLLILVKECLEEPEITSPEN